MSQRTHRNSRVVDAATIRTGDRVTWQRRLHEASADAEVSPGGIVTLRLRLDAGTAYTGENLDKVVQLAPGAAWVFANVKIRP